MSATALRGFALVAALGLDISCGLAGCAHLPAEGSQATGPAIAALNATLMVIPAGSFTMGDVSGNGQEWERPTHLVTLKSFKLSRFDVTFDQYDAFAKATGHPLPDDGGWGRGQRPVINVTWDDAQSFIQWLNQQGGRHFRLPSEAEWEYAARAATHTVYPWGNADAVGRRNGADSVNRTTPVGSYPANAWGLFDMVGNVWQWTQDCWLDGYGGAPTDGSAYSPSRCEKGHAYRGGSWGNDPSWLRVAARGRGEATFIMDGLGFRLAEDR